ncbi:MAG: iron-sulfur cluster assembly scaffold protein, partial [Candidatus Kerfeldbacteria bacterium]|nr:iron-sulfur cluster assembly scaffold protein [Candidatus Kerfeldbacteria bacterium]
MSFAMYRQNVLDHAKHPRHWGLLEHADQRAHADNPLCADALDVTVKFADGTIADLGFQGEGCTIMKAGASMLAEAVVGKSVAEARQLTVDDVVRLFGVSVNPARLKCATLG